MITMMMMKMMMATACDDDVDDNYYVFLDIVIAGRSLVLLQLFSTTHC